MGKLRKFGKKIGKGFKKIGRKLKKGLGKIARAFGKLGPLGSIALSFIIPGIGGWIGNLAGQSGAGFLGTIATGIQNAAGFIGEGASRVFTRITDAIGAGMNKVGSLFNKGNIGSNFQNFVSEVTNGFIKPADVQNLPTIEMPLQASPPEGFVGETTVTAPRAESFKEAAKARGERMFSPSDKPKLFSEESKFGVDGEKLKFKERLRGSREYSTFKKIAPITAVGSQLIADENAEKFAIAQSKKYQREYFSDFGQDVLIRPQDPTSNYIDFNNPNPSDEDIYNINNAYGLILG